MAYERPIMTNPILLALVLSVVAIALLMLTAGVVLGNMPFFQRILSGRASMEEEPPLPLQDEGLLAEVVACNAAVDQLRVDLTALRSEMYWIAGESVINQAIQMCRDGLPSDQIGADTGLPEETVRALRLLRCH